MNKDLQKPATLTLKAKVTPDTVLIDIRPYKRKFNFGTVKGLCKTFGIKMVEKEGYCEFSAPKNQLQLFLEKLHFSGTQHCRVVQSLPSAQPQYTRR